jgi:hypothetical protein
MSPYRTTSAVGTPDDLVAPPRLLREDFDPSQPGIAVHPEVRW